MIKYKKFGYNNLGPLLWGFSHWLMDNIEKENISKVYFFSRDGYIMKKAFELIFPQSKVHTSYLEVSRRSLRVPILWKNYSLENVYTMLSPSRFIPIASIFDAVGLDVLNYKSLLSTYGFTFDSVLKRDELLSCTSLKSMYKELFSDIKANSLEEYEKLKLYIHKNNIGGKFAIVDIGWSGGMQRFLQDTLNQMGINNDIYGFYTGVAKYYKRNLINGQPLKLYGYLFDFSKNSHAIDPRSCFVGLYELLFLETKGSVKKYEIDRDNNVCAVRYPYEFSDSPYDKKAVTCIEKVQEGALMYITKHKGEFPREMSSLVLCNSLLHFGQNPSLRDVEMFGDFPFFDEGKRSYLAKPNKLVYYLFHYSIFKKDFMESRWKTGFLKRLLKIPLPYYRIYNLLNKYAK